MSIPPIGAAITINSDCSRCCPRRLKIFCCCCKVDDDAQDRAERVNETAETVLPKAECKHKKKAANK